MKSLINPTKNPFRNRSAKILFEKMSTNSDVSEFGIDTKGKIYFSYANGVIKRFTRKEFIDKAESEITFSL